MRFRGIILFSIALAVFGALLQVHSLIAVQETEVYAQIAVSMAVIGLSAPTAVLAIHGLTMAVSTCSWLRQLFGDCTSEAYVMVRWLLGITCAFCAALCTIATALLIVYSTLQVSISLSLAGLIYGVLCWLYDSSAGRQLSELTVA